MNDPDGPHTEPIPEILRANLTPILFSVPRGYTDLAGTLRRALAQAVEGKGKERHAITENMLEQPIITIQGMVGTGFATGQAIKKLQESSRLGKDAAIEEILGAIIYCAAAVIHLEKP